MRSLLFFVLFFAPGSLFAKQLIERVVAIVNNEPILLSQLNGFSERLKQEGMIDELLVLDGGLSELKKDRTAQLNFLINEKLLDSEVKRQNLTITMERVDQELRDIAKKNGLSKDELFAAIKQQGLSASEYQHFLKTRIERQSLIEGEITSKIKVSDEDVLAFYLGQTKSSLGQIYEYNISHILFLPKKDGGGGQGALERAQAVQKKLAGSKGFEALAEEYSEDPNFSRGAILGNFKSGDFLPELEEAVKDLSPGETSKSVVKSRMGFHILKLNSKKVVSDPRFEKEKERYRSILFEQTFKRQFKLWLEQKKESAFVKINS